MTNHCDNTDSSKEEIGRSIALPVLDSKQSRKGSGAPMMGRTRVGYLRAGVLTLVNLLMIAHLIQWMIAGTTISPLEPSEAMETLEVGVINAGAILFLLTFLSTLILGRFFCGWLCHVVALQDLCAYMMTSIGIRPKPFRSRLMVYFPFALGMYMFVWPTFKRLALAPVLKSAEIGWPAWLTPVEPIHQFSTALIVDDFWATMPPWYIAVPFLFICGFAAVYFLGAKGFCTYGCPYAAFFKPMDKVAPLRVRVNDDCHQCGYCTSVCTSNVRVSEEVRDFGMVVDAGCMKTLDCISACPNDALSLGFGKPALGAKPISPETYIQSKAKRSRRFDMTLTEELIASGLMLWFFFATRGMLDAVPMLMAGGLASIAVMLVMTCVKVFKTSNVRLYSFTLKSQGKIKLGGFVILALGASMILGSVWSGHARAMRWRGDVLYAGGDVPTTILLRYDFMASETQRAHAESAVAAYRRADSPSNGGYGWKLNAEHRLRMSYFLSVLGRFDESVEQLMIVIDEGNPTDDLIHQVGEFSDRAINANPPENKNTINFSAYKVERRMAIYRHALEAHPDLHGIRTELARNAVSINDIDRAQAYWEIDTYKDEPYFHLSYGAYTGFVGRMDETRAHFEKARDLSLSELDRPAGALIDIAFTALGFGTNDMKALAVELAQLAVDHDSADALTWVAASEVANTVGEMELGKQRALQALSMPGADRSLVKARIAGALIREEDTTQGRELLFEAVEAAQGPFDVDYIAHGMVKAGAALGDMVLMERGVELFGELTKSHPDLYVIGSDYATVLYSVGRDEDALVEMMRVANADSRNPAMAMRASELAGVIGNEEQRVYWEIETQKRQHALDEEAFVEMVRMANADSRNPALAKRASKLAGVIGNEEQRVFWEIETQKRQQALDKENE